MKPGDLVRYKSGRFVTGRVQRRFVGLVIKRAHGPMIRVRWNSDWECLWHRPRDLEVISESR